MTAMPGALNVDSNGGLLRIMDCAVANASRRRICPGRPPPNVVPTRNAHIQYLCDRMRPDEIEQYVALSYADRYDPEAAATFFQNIGGPKFTVVDATGMPAACGGYAMVAPGVWQSWMVGSMDGWSTCWRSMTKAIRWLMGALLEGGDAHRLQTHVLASRTRAIEWYERSLGLQFEGLERKKAKGGADVALYAMVAED